MGSACVGGARGEETAEGERVSYKYDDLPTDADLCVASLQYALSMHPRRRLFVPAGLYECAKHVLEYHGELNITPGSIDIVIDYTLGPHEWYISMAVGSDPT